MLSLVFRFCKTVVEPRPLAAVPPEGWLVNFEGGGGTVNHGCGKLYWSRANRQHAFVVPLVECRGVG